MKAKIILLIAALLSLPSILIAHADGTPQPTSTKYDEVKIKHRARRYNGQVSPNRELWVHLTDSDLLQSQNENNPQSPPTPQIQPQQKVRKINVLVTTSPSTLRLLEKRNRHQQDEIQIGTIALKSESLLRQTTINSIIRIQNH